MIKNKMENKSYPEDYTEKQREEIKELVIARLQSMPSNMRISIG